MQTTVYQFIGNHVLSEIYSFKKGLKLHYVQVHKSFMILKDPKSTLVKMAVSSHEIKVCIDHFLRSNASADDYGFNPIVRSKKCFPFCNIYDYQ
jgi:hypothetical protein